MDRCLTCGGITFHLEGCMSPGMIRFTSFDGPTKLCDMCEGDGVVPSDDPDGDPLDADTYIACEACDGEGLVPTPKP